ncbi:MAG TPA: lanthionine synthetase C family protein [Kofleriaceae bacterium]
MTWSPIVERARVAPVLADITAAIDGHPREHHSELVDYVVLRGYLDSDGAIPDPDDRSGEALSAAIDGLARLGGTPALYGGAARVGWTVAHHADGDDASSACQAIDGVLLRQLEGWTRDYDLISGLVGFGVYAVERGEAGAEVARAVLTGLEAYAARGWLTGPELLPAHQRKIAPEGYVNFGLAHGIPGVIAVLAQFCRVGFEPVRARAVLDSALRRLLDTSPPRRRGRFTAWQPMEHPPSVRLAWCYGDLGVAAALLGAGLAIGHDEARAEGLAVALDCAERSLRDAQITDTGICHGAAGIAHLFNRMAQATGEAALRAAAVTWIGHTLAMRTELPLAGFPANLPEDDGQPRMIADASLLTGAAGVALVLHAASSDIEPSWDRLLLVEMPPRD